MKIRRKESMKKDGKPDKTNMKDRYNTERLKEGHRGASVQKRR